MNKQTPRETLDSIDAALLDVPFGRTEQVTPKLPSYASDNPDFLIAGDRDEEFEQIAAERRSLLGSMNNSNPYRINFSYPVTVDGILYYPSDYKYGFFSVKPLGTNDEDHYYYCRWCSDSPHDFDDFIKDLDYTRNDDIAECSDVSEVDDNWLERMGETPADWFD